VGGRISALQNRLNLLDQRDVPGLLAACGELGVGYLPYSPLANGLLSGKYRGGAPAPAGSRLEGRQPDAATLARVAALEALAHAGGLTLLELAIAWLCAQPAVSAVIVGVTSAAQLHANLAATTLTLSTADLAAVAGAGAQAVAA
jgi:aryl-alcohol dehydrogenase-like predicted oxidoreductase